MDGRVLRAQLPGVRSAYEPSAVGQGTPEVKTALSPNQQGEVWARGRGLQHFPRVTLDEGHVESELHKSSEL